MPPSKKQLDNLRKELRKKEVLREDIMIDSNLALKKLSNGNLLTEPAEYLANICVELDVKYDVGSTLTLDWFLEQYIAMEFERRVYKLFVEAWKILKERNHTYKNQYEYFSDAEAFYIPHETKRIIVMGSWWSYGGSKVLVIDDTETRLFKKFYVRRIWKKTKLCYDSIEQPTLAYYRKRNFDMGYGKNQCFYGDCRDPGHIMTYDNSFIGHSKCDKVIWDLIGPIRWFFNVNTLWTQLMED